MTDLLHHVDVVRLRGNAAATEVESVEFDSRLVRPGSLFCCLPGERTDGHLHAAAAVRQGAVALVCERELDLPVAEVLVPEGEVRSAMAEIAAAFHGHPARDVITVGVTGTNGKTTVTHLVRSILEHAGLRPASSAPSTANGPRPRHRSSRASWPTSATPGGRSCIEVTSHALVQHRVDGMTFDVAAFTNLSQDHLDFHATMEEYFAAKATLFTGRTDSR